jgi:hypothetical protein
VNKWVTIAASVLSDFCISGGGAYLAGSSNNQSLTTTFIITCVVTGVVQAARGVQKLLAPPPS